MKKLHVIIVCLLLLLVGCKTTKQSTAEKTKEDTHISLNVSTEKTMNHQEKTTTIRADETQVDETIVETIHETTWSEPDSTGKQHPTKTSTTKREKQAKTTTDSNVKTENQADTNIKEENTDKSKLTTDNTTKKTDDTKTESNTPAWVVWVAVIGSLGAVLLAYLILKRFKIVK